MKTLIAGFLIIAASGCATQQAAVGIGIGAVLSLDLCHNVDYQRRGSEIKLQAECRAPLK